VSPSPRKGQAKKVTATAPAPKAKVEDEGSSIFANANDGDFFTDHAQDQKFLALKQASKLEYYRKENEQLKEQVKNLSTNLRLNKQLLAMTETNTSQSLTNNAIADRSSHGPEAS